MTERTSQSDAEFFKQRGFGLKIGFGERPALLVIDMLKAGNVGGELLNWIAMLGAIGNRKPNYIAPQMANGHAYGVWRWN